MILYHSIVPSSVDGARDIRTVGCLSEDGSRSTVYSSDTTTPWIKWKGASSGSEPRTRLGWKYARYDGTNFPTRTVDHVEYLRAYLHVGITAEGHMLFELDRNDTPNSLLDCYCIAIPASEVQKGTPFSIKIPWCQAPSMGVDGISFKHVYANIVWQVGVNPALVLASVTAERAYDTEVTPTWPRPQHNQLAVYANYWDNLPSGTVCPALGNFETAQALLNSPDFMESVEDAAKDAASELLTEYKGRYVSC